MNNKKGVLILLILCLLPIVNAFELTSIENSASTCPGSTIVLTTNVQGSGDFTVNLDGTASQWAVAVPQGFSLNNQNKVVYAYITPSSYALPGAYNLNLIASNSIETKTLSYTINVNNCHSLTLTGDSSKAICACNTDVLNFNILNTGNYQETYSLEIQGASQDWMTLSQDSITLAPNEQKTIYAYATIPCNTNPSNYGFTLTTKNNYLTKSINSNAQVNNCFDYDFITNKDYISMCDHAVENIELTLNNKGSNTNKFFIEKEGPLFANLQNTELIVDGLQSKKTSLILSPDYNIEGSFNIVLKARNDYGKIQKQKNIVVDIRKCNSVLLEILENQDRICSSLSKLYQAKLKNTGETTKDFKLETSESWAVLDKYLINLKPNEEYDFNIDVTPSSTISGINKIYVRALALDTNKISSEDFVNIEVVSSENCYKPNIKADNIIIPQDSSATLPVVIENKGTQPAKYILSISGTASSFARLNPAVIDLDPDKSEVVYLYIAPSNLINKGDYKSTLSVILDGVILESKTINIKVSEIQNQISGGATAEPSEGFFAKLKNWISNLFTLPVNFSEERLVTKDTKFILNNEKHVLKIKSVDQNFVIILIESNPITDTINVGESKEYDINNDNIADLKIILESIIEGVPQLKISEIKNEIETELEEIEIESEEEPVDELENITEDIEVISEEPQESNLVRIFNTYKMYILYSVIGVIALIILIIIFRSLSAPVDNNKKKKKKEEEYDFEEESEDEGEPLKLGRWIVGIIVLAALIYLVYKYKILSLIKNYALQTWSYVLIGIRYVLIYKYYILIGLFILLIFILIFKYWDKIINFFEEEDFEEEKPKKKKRK